MQELVADFKGVLAKKKVKRTIFVRIFSLALIKRNRLQGRLATKRGLYRVREHQKLRRF